MQSVRLKIDVPASHKVELELPPELPIGPAEVVVFSRRERREGRLPPADLAAAKQRWSSMVEGLNADPRPFESLSQEERRARLEKLIGAGKGLLSSPDEFVRYKQEEIDLEEAKFARRG